MRRIGKGYIIILISILALCINNTGNIFGEEIDEIIITADNILDVLNSDIHEIYNIEGYYKEFNGDLETRKQLRKDLVNSAVEKIESGDDTNLRIAYGTAHGNYQNAKTGREDEYLGYTPNGLHHVENPNYKWTGWSGVPIQNMNLVKIPWDNDSRVADKSIFDGRNVEYTMPDGTKRSINDAIQKGLNVRYGDKKRADVVYNGSTSDNTIVYTKDAAPRNGGQWIDYVHIVQPPTYYTWGQGYMYINGSGYMGVAIAPFKLVDTDLSVSFEGPLPGKTKPTYPVKMSVVVKSNFPEDVETKFVWTIEGVDREKITYSGYSDGNKGSGKCTIPSGEMAIFTVEFEMSDQAQKVVFEINPAPRKPKEMIFNNNKISFEVPLYPFIPTSTNYTLDYDELSKEIEHEIAGSGTTATVTLPEERSWNGPATGSLNVSINNDESALRSAQIKEGTNEPVNEESESVTRRPILQGTISRPDYGDDPDNYYASNNISPVVKSMSSTFAGSISRPYLHVYYTTESDGTYADGTPKTKSVRHEDHGTAQGTFVEGENKVKIATYIYNGRENMPDVVARHFKKEIDNNTNTSLTKTIWWESDEYPRLVQRWMSHVYLDKDTEWVPIEGQYERIFTQQNEATVTWGIDKSMAQIYVNDRENAKNKSKKKGDYKYAPFATDRELQGYAYPFKSGYYFNPAGIYTLTVRTEIYKEEQKSTEEHKALVDELIGAFRYESTMDYKINNSPEKLLLQFDNPEDERPTEELLVAERDYKYVIDYEIPYSLNASGYTHDYYKEILEGYSESNTENSKTGYKYREYIKEKNIYRVIEETTVSIIVNENNTPMYTYGGMKNGTYYTNAWIDNVDISAITKVSNMKLQGINTSTSLDHISINVKGSMYDDLNN